jgi:hypothetical protein
MILFISELPSLEVYGHLAQLRRLDDADVTPISESGQGLAYNTKKRDM